VSKTNPALIDAIIPFKDNTRNLAQLEKWLVKSNIPPQIRIILIHDIQFSSKCIFRLRKIKTSFERDRFILITGKFGSPGTARNAGLDKVTSNWVVFWDSDDLPEPKKYLDMILMSESKNAKICIGRCEIIEIKNKVHSKATESSCLLNVAYSPGIWRMAFMSKLLQGTRFSDSPWGEDQRFLIDIDILEHRIFQFKQVVYSYYKGVPNQLVGAKKFVGNLAAEIIHSLEALEARKGIRKIFLYSVMISRMTGTIVKNSEFREFRKTLLNVAFFYFKRPIRLFIGFIPSITLVVVIILTKKAIKGIANICRV